VRGSLWFPIRTPNSSSSHVKLNPDEMKLGLLRIDSPKASLSRNGIGPSWFSGVILRLRRAHVPLNSFPLESITLTFQRGGDGTLSKFYWCCVKVVMWRYLSRLLKWVQVAFFCDFGPSRSRTAGGLNGFFHGCIYRGAVRYNFYH
jgi:hypothetical protein